MKLVDQKRKSRPHKSPKNRADTWMDAVEAIAAKGNPANDAVLEAALTEVRRRNKEHARRKSGN